MDVDTNEKREYQNCIRIMDEEPVVTRVLLFLNCFYR